MLSRSFFKKRTATETVKHNHLPPKVLFATLIHDDQIKLKPVHCLVKHETVLPSLKDDYHPSLAQFGNDQFPCRKGKEG